MFRGNQQYSAKHTNDNEKQKQKKRLSFREPEIEGPKSLSGKYVNSNPQSFDQINPSRSYSSFGNKEDTVSLEDLSLEDQAFVIVRNVGQAFVKPVHRNAPSFMAPGCLQVPLGSSKHTQEEESRNKDRSPAENPSLSRNYQNSKQTIATADNNQSLLDALTPVPPDTATMRCPAIEMSESRLSPSKNVVTAERVPTSAQHQIQMMKYQSDQQNQHIQTALHQIQLLKDQLEAEGAARYKAQTQNHQLMLQNQELLDHIQGLFERIQELETQVARYESDASAGVPELKQVTAAPYGMRASGYRRCSTDAQSMQLSTITSKPTSNTSSRRGSMTISKQYQKETADSSTKEDLSLSIVDDSPPIQTRIGNPFEPDWKLKLQGPSANTSRSSTNYSKTSNGGLSISENFRRSSIDAASERILPLVAQDTTNSSRTKNSSNCGSDSYCTNAFSTSKSLVIDESPPHDNGSAVSMTKNSKVENSRNVAKDKPSYPVSSYTSRNKQGKETRGVTKKPETPRLFNS